MAGALESGNWEKVGPYLQRLIENINEIKSAYGIYAIGFQRCYDAPEDIKILIDQYNKLVIMYHDKEKEIAKKNKSKNKKKG